MLAESDHGSEAMGQSAAGSPLEDIPSAANPRFLQASCGVQGVAQRGV